MNHGLEKSQSSNDSQLASGLDAGAFPSPAGSPGARAGVDGQSRDSASRRRGMERLTGAESRAANGLLAVASLALGREALTGGGGASG